MKFSDTQVRESLWYTLERCTKDEIKLIKESLNDGMMDFGQFWGESECGCLIGTVIHSRTEKIDICMQDVQEFRAPMYCEPIFGTSHFESYFMRIERGDTPHNSALAQELMILIEEFEEQHE